MVSLLTGGIVARETEQWKLSRMSPETTTTTTTTTTISTLLAENVTGLGEVTVAGGGGEVVDADEIAYKIQVATSVAFITGLAQVGLTTTGVFVAVLCVVVVVVVAVGASSLSSSS